MKKETIGFTIALMLLFGGYIALQNYYLKKQLNQPVQQQSQPLQMTQTVKPLLLESKPVAIASGSDLKITRNDATFEFTHTGGCLGNNFLTNEKTAYNNPSPVSVIDNYNVCKAFGFRAENADLRSQPAEISKTADGVVAIVQRTKNLEITRLIKFTNENYGGELQIQVKNISNTPINTTVDMEIGASSDTKHSGGMFASTPPQFHSAAIRLSDESVKREFTPFEKSPEQKVMMHHSGVTPTWMTADSLYWMNTLMPLFRTPVDFDVIQTGFNLKKDALAEVDQTVFEAWIKHPVQLAAGQSNTFQYKVYFGPKDETILKKYDGYHLNETIDYGFFKIVARPLYYILTFIHSIVQNWGVAIIVLTLFINLVFLPLQIKGYSSAQKMQIVQPKIKELQEKYKDDKQTLQKETMGLMAKHGVNPLSGCLPLLPQIPVFFGLNSTLSHTFDLRQAPFFFWIHDLTIYDPYFVLPVLMAILMVGYQKLIPMPSMDPTQAKMMKILPLIFSIFMVFYPSGLALYVITNTIVSMIRQTFLLRHFKKKPHLLKT